MRRKQYIDWLATVFGIFGTVYGTYLLIWHYNLGNGLNVLALVLLLLGVLSLTFAIALLTSRYIAQKKKKEDAPPVVIEEEKAKEPQPIEKIEEPKTIETPKKEYVRYENKSRYDSNSYSRSSTIYVKLVGHGPILRVEGSRILDMRKNTYYRIENNIVKEEGNGPRYEIRGNKIRDVFGGYLYEISGNNINKVVGGFYASISGNYITIYDLSQKYETTGSLSKAQILTVAALLFDR